MFLSASDFLRLRSLGHADSVDSCQVRQTTIASLRQQCAARRKLACQLTASVASRT